MAHSCLNLICLNINGKRNDRLEMSLARILWPNKYSWISKYNLKTKSKDKKSIRLFDLGHSKMMMRPFNGHGIQKHTWESHISNLGENRLIYIKCDSINMYVMAPTVYLWAQNIKYVDRFICKFNAEDSENLHDSHRKWYRMQSILSMDWENNVDYIHLVGNRIDLTFVFVYNELYSHVTPSMCGCSCGVDSMEWIGICLKLVCFMVRKNVIVISPSNGLHLSLTFDKMLFRRWTHWMWNKIQLDKSMIMRISSALFTLS